MEKSNFLIVLGILAIFLILACCCCAGLGGIGFWKMQESEFEFSSTIEVTMEVPFDYDDATPVPTPILTREPAGDAGAETEELLEAAVIPVRDLHDLAIRLSGLDPETPRTVNPSGSPDYEVGDRRTFHVSNVDTDEQFDIEAVLEYKTEHVYMWVESGARFQRDNLEAAADLFEEETYSTNREFFGSEWSPGVDNDPHLSILHARDLGNSVAGYYSSADEFVAEVRDDSNEMEMFYINIDNVTINDEFYNGVLAHEFQHMIHWYNDRNEETWLNEGFSELATFLNDFDVGGSDWVFAMEPDTQLNSWPEGPGAAGANYGAAYLFTSYFLDRFGSDATKALVAHPENSFASVEVVLNELNADLSYEELFADWVVANLVDDPSIEDGHYGYQAIDPPSFDIETTYYGNAYPVSESAVVSQHGTDYIELEGERPLTFRFTGSTQVGLVDTSAYSGRYFWWSNRSDDSDMMLTRAFDLSDVGEEASEELTLEFWTWYDIEEDWDYAYVEISADGGESWEILTTPSGTSTNPNGNSFGWAYTGRSGSGSSAEWIQERVDISAYAGQEVQIRFEYITDDAVNRPGFILDDLAIPAIGYFDDFEEDGEGSTMSSSNGWNAAGFIRHANVLPQRWLVQMILYGSDGRVSTVDRLELNGDQSGALVVPLDSRSDRAVIAVSGLAPVTTEWASYNYEVEER
jgi:immune inhibitor A